MNRRHPLIQGLTPASLTLAVVAVLALSGCGAKKQTDATQVAEIGRAHV
jgi:hypothetical protein